MIGSGYPTPHVQLAIATHLPDRGRDGRRPSSRNHLVVLNADVIVALPGSHGTETELELALEYGRPVVIYGETGRSVEAPPAAIRRVDSIGDLEGILRAWLTIDEPKRGEDRCS